MAVNWRKIFTSPYSDKTHFIYELIQNADDSKSKHLELQLRENDLIVWNDGCQFTRKDMDSICSIGFSNKDLTQIGTFGMGITAVFTYTDCLEVYSGDKHFCIKIKDPTKRENIDFDEIDPTIIDQLNKGRTVFRLPFRKKLRQEDLEKLRDRLCNVGEKRPLLFLRHLERIVWRNELGAQIGSYFCHRCRSDKMQDASEVELTTSPDDNNQRKETFLVFNKKVQPPQNVIDELLYLAEDDTEQQRIQQSVKKPQPIEVAFRLQDSRITAMADKCMLFSYLSTQKETHLRFIIQARYQTTLARENIEDIEDNLWNRWLVRETANFLPEVLEQLKYGGLLEPAFFDVLPLKGEVEKAFKPIAKTLRKAMRERLLVPTQDGAYTKAENVLYPHDELLRELFESSWLRPNSSWLHSDIEDKKEFYRRFTVMQQAGVDEIDFRKILRRLEEQDSGWFESKSNEWLCSLYTYLSKHQSELERIKKLPLVRLENDQHVCASEAFFPPETDEAREEIAPFLKELPILQSALLEGEEGHDIKAFLDKLGVEGLDPEDMIGKWILPQYSRCDKPSEEQNLLHVRYIFKVWDKLKDWKYRQLKEELCRTPVLHAYNNSQPETSNFLKPCDTYLPQTYIGDTHLETYFSVSNGEYWFVDGGYLEGNSDSKEWFKFLKAMGAMDTPLVVKENILAYYRDHQEFDKRNIEREWSNHEQTIEDFYLQGLLEVLDEISVRGKVNFSQALWDILVKTVPSEKSSRDTFFQGTHHWFHHRPRSKSFEATFYRQLKETAWLPDEQGNLHCPSECFAPTSENRRVLEDSVVYLHPDFDVSEDNEAARWLVEKLGSHLNANTESVLHYLQTLSGTEVNVEKVEPLYRFLARQDARPREKFNQKSLILTSNPDPHWWRLDEVFWEDESAVFGNSRGYLKNDYAYPAGTLKTFFNALGVSERAAPLDYVCGIRDAASAGQAENAEVRKRVKILYHHIMLYLREEDSLLEDEEWSEDPFFESIEEPDRQENLEWQEKWGQTRESRCWLGKKGNEWNFFFRNELVWDDHPYIAEIFQGKVPFWAFDDDLLEFAKDQGVKGCSEASITFHPSGDREEDTGWSEKVRELRPYINAFLKSPILCKEHEEGESTEILDYLSVCLVEELRMTYTLKEIPVTSPNPHPSALASTDQKVTLWLALAADKNEYAELIGDTLQDYFRVKELGRFVEDLLTKNRNRVLSRWNQKGLRTDLYELALEVDTKESEKKPLNPIDAKLPVEIVSEDDSGTNDSEVETPTIHEDPETGNENSGSTAEESNTPTHQPRPGRGRARWPGGSGNNTLNRRTGTGYGGGRGEREEHRSLKEYLADNPLSFGEGLELVGIEYRFRSGDEVDILFEDNFGNPVTVEVKSPIPSGSDQEAWQAVKYQHLAAVEYDLPCEEVRSILAAPRIPEDVKKKCEELGIEPVEISQQ